MDRQMADEFIERMVGHGSVLDEELDEFVQPTIPDAQYLTEEIENLFTQPFEKHDLDEANQSILALMTFEGNRKKYIRQLKSVGLTLEEAKDTYKEELALMVKAALPEKFLDEEE